METYRRIDGATLRGMRCIGTAAAITLGAIALGCTASAQVYNPITNCYDDTAGLTSFCPHAGPSGPAGPKVGYDPCYLAQNAMRPCTPQQRQSPAPVGIDRNIVGTWELSVPNAQGVSRWVWQIRPDGSYDFHAEGPDAAPAHRGTFAASKGHYILNSTTMAWKDSGTYQLTANDTLVAKGLLGTGSWHRIQPTSVAASRNQPTNPSVNLKR